MPRKKNWTPGNVVAVPLEEGGYGFGVVITPSLTGFFNIKSDEPEMPSNIEKAELLFSIWVMNRAISKNHWKVIGEIEIPKTYDLNPWFYKFDFISKKYSLTKDGGDEAPATLEECKKHECAAVWDPEHVESRLTDHFAGRENDWVKQLQAENQT